MIQLRSMEFLIDLFQHPRYIKKWVLEVTKTTYARFVSPALDAGTVDFRSPGGHPGYLHAFSDHYMEALQKEARSLVKEDLEVYEDVIARLETIGPKYPIWLWFPELGDVLRSRMEKTQYCWIWVRRCRCVGGGTDLLRWHRWTCTGTP